MFSSRGEEEFQKNAEQDLAEAHAMEAEQTLYLKPIVFEAEEKAQKEIADASDEGEKVAACVRYAIEFLAVYLELSRMKHLLLASFGEDLNFHRVSMVNLPI